MKETRKYKQTELGLLPEDWEVVKLGEIGELAMCKRIFQNETSEMGDVPFYKIGTFGKTPDAYISYAKYLEFKSAYRFPNEGDILISAAGTIGRIVVYDGKPAYFQDSNIVWLAHNGKTLRNDFLFYVYQITDWYTENTTIARLYNDNFNKTTIPFPPIEEQRRIASALTCIDNLIDSLDRLIAKKRDIKQGAMQQLLSGKKRLKGFTEPWVEKKLGDVALFPTGNITCNDFNSALFVTTDNMMPNRMGIVPFDGQISYTNVREYKTADVLTSNIRPYLKKIWLANCNGGCSSDVIVLRANCSLILPSFLYMVVGNDTFFNYSMDNAIGTKMPRGNKKALKEYLLALPSKEEQQAIASVLTSMDNELSALEAKRKKYEQIKQGMMQQLLTGRIRLENTSTLLSANTL